MPDSLAVIFLVCTALHCAMSGVAGYAVAHRRGKHQIASVVVCAVLPWLGVLALIAVTSGRLPTNRSPRNPLRWAGIAALALGGVLVLLSLADDWASAHGTADKYRETLGGGPSDSGAGTAVIAMLGLVLIAFAVAAWRHGGLRFAIPVAWVATCVASVLISAILVTDVLNDLAGGVATFTGGQATASLEVGSGAWCALGGAILSVLGAVALMLSAGAPTSRFSAPAPTAEYGVSRLDSWQPTGGAVPASGAFGQAGTTGIESGGPHAAGSTFSTEDW